MQGGLSFTSLIVGVFVLASCVLFGLSITYDAYYFENGTAKPWALLAFGWAGLFDKIVAWFANPLLAIAMVLAWSPSTRVSALGFSSIAVALALSFLLVRTIMINEGGGRAKITGYGDGYWLWVSSIVTTFAGCLCGVILERLEQTKSLPNSE